ncbi:uncharacterized protein BDZ99DRAFT_282566 [Mytilinidion resinicola]|uniref:BTB domain-containing protein n=1 Tax=Mytilinidion resinicola TaxID=574789 RepID=A0A6A6YU29_9PEZI|nr:uncharacterized protein BDZ99DRAFT_282566 [Mytilinidion resinicola]KAF2811893.1 hypothetical protein BDZ99DRAFT_282566 [Mytilinidion resinicola]
MDSPKETDDNPPETIEVVLDKRGDVIFELGGIGQPLTRLRVSSKVLTLASPVFDAMFNHGFAEGQNLSSASPRVVFLREDHSESMTILCQICHIRNQDVPKTLTVDLLAELTILCDKYDCVSAIQPWSVLWARELLPRTREPGSEKLLFIAYRLELPMIFFQLTETLVKDRESKVNFEIACAGQDSLPTRIVDDIEENRAERRQRLVNAIINGITPILKGSKATSHHCVRELVSEYFFSLAKVDLWPLLEGVSRYSSSEIFQKLDSLTATNEDNCECDYSSNSCFAVSQSASLVHTLKEEIKAIEMSYTGICLDCSMAGRNSYDSKICRVKH